MSEASGQKWVCKFYCSDLDNSTAILKRNYDFFSSNITLEEVIPWDQIFTFTDSAYVQVAGSTSYKWNNTDLSYL